MNPLLRRIRNRIRGRRILSREYPVDADDAYLVSYPKSGNTWSRFLIANCLKGEAKVDFATIDRTVPDIYGISQKDLTALPKPRILKSHEYFDPRYRRVIYLVRDPRSVAVSYYHHLIRVDRLDREMEFARYLDGFLAGEYGRWGSWSQHVGSWLWALENDEDKIVVRYEDLHADTLAQLRRMMNILDLSPDDTVLRRAIENSSFERMRRIPLPRDHQHAQTAGGQEAKTNEFVREGKTQGWKHSLSADDRARIEGEFQALMRRFGYLEDSIE